MQRTRRRSVISLIVASLWLASGGWGRPAAAADACATEAGYLACGRVFPDPQAGGATDPLAEGNTPASDFIQFGTPGQPPGSEIWDGLRFLEARYGRWLEVWTLEDLLGNPDARSAGLWLGGQRQRLPLIMVRVTDETVPSSEKQRFVFGLSLHGIERAGAEGGTRAIEDFATYAYCESLGSLDAARADDVCALQTQVKRADPESFPPRLLPWDETSITMGESLKRSELYFTYNNPDGWHRGDKESFGGIGHYQRYNGNGVDPNREWPTVGYTYRPYTPASEPETKYFMEALLGRGKQWAGGIDLHGMTTAPAFTYTMMPAGQNDYRKNLRARMIAERTQTDAHHRLAWSPLIAAEPSKETVQVQGFGSVGVMVPQQWGTVWDTIDYTITGAYGDWMNNADIGLGAIGMDNEMALSHVSNCGVGSCFVPEIEQLHIAGNKGLIYADIDTTLRTSEERFRFPFAGRGAYIEHDRVIEGARKDRARLSGSYDTQEPIEGVLACQGPTMSCVREFDVKGPGDGILNGGLVADVAYGATHSTADTSGDFVLERLDSTHGEPEWEEVAAAHQSGQAYFNNGVTVSVNDPVPGRFRLRIRGAPAGPYTFRIAFTREQAWHDPGQLPYEVSNLDFFDELNRYLPEQNRFEGVTAARVIRDPGLLEDYDVVVLADEPLAGWDEAKPSRSTISRADHDRYYRALRSFVRRGGTLVLLDGALQAMVPLTGAEALEANRSREYAGWIGFTDGEDSTYDDPLARGINVPGAAEGSNARRQTYEPVPLGFTILDGFSPRSTWESPVWGVDQSEFEDRGGRTAGTTSAGVSLGELKLGRGRVRIAGALLPTPSNKADHPFGLSSYALTYSGWQLFENLVRVKAAGGDADPVRPQVLGEQRTLPRTGIALGLAGVAFILLCAMLVVRKLRHTTWV